MKTNFYSQMSGPCEDAPCCGCCGPQGDGDYYGQSDMERDVDDIEEDLEED